MAYRRWLVRRPLPALTKLLHLRAVERRLADEDADVADDLARHAIEDYRRLLEDAGTEGGS